MATYKGIQGYTVQSLASDPTAEDTVGKLWYNSASNVWKISSEGSGAWSSGGPYGVSMFFGGGIGTQTAAIVALGGRPPPAPARLVAKEYDGTSWTAIGSCNSYRYGLGGAGSTTAGIIFGGTEGPIPPPGYTEIYNGTAWTEVADMIVGRQYVTSAMAGTTTAAMCMGGTTGADQKTCEQFNGTAWAEVGDLSTAKQYGGGAGTITGALYSGGNPALVTCESFNGTSWTEVGDLNTGQSDSAGAGATNTAALHFAGSPYSTNCEKWNGTSWTEVGALATGRSATTSVGSSSAALAVVGNSSPAGTLVTEEWNDPAYTVTTVTTS